MKTVAVIGASTRQQKFGNKAVRAWRHQGYRVIPVHPSASVVEGERAYASVLDYDGAIDEATMYVPPETGLRVLDELARKGIPRVWLNPGADAPEVVAKARALGLEAIVACSILGIGESPSAY